MSFKWGQVVEVKHGPSPLGESWAKVVGFRAGTRFQVLDDTGSIVNVRSLKGIKRLNGEWFRKGHLWQLKSEAVEPVLEMMGFK